MNENNLIGVIILWGQYSFFLELYIAMLIVLFYAKKRKLFWVRALVGAAVGFPCYYLPNLSLFGFNYTYLIVMSIVFVLGLFLYDEKIFPILLSSVAAWALQHVSWNILGVIYDLIPNVGQIEKAWLLLIKYFVYIVVYGVFLLCLLKMKIKITFNKRQLWSFVFASIVVVATMFLSQSVTEWNISYRLYTTLVALLTLTIMLGYPYLSDLVINERNLTNEKNNLENMLSLQAKQQELSKETTDIINLKFHDMKNQLMSMRSMSLEDRTESAKEIEKSIDIYSDIAKTGNQAMDIVITQKSLLCTSNKIRFTYIIDGTSLSFMNKSDITSLFGNILDNAIEACEKEEGEFRLIKMRTYLQKGFVIIQEENYCHSLLQFGKNGLPISSKKDEINHGYGSKSILYLVEKYQGQLKMEQKDDVFYLSILIPVPSLK